MNIIFFTQTKSLDVFYQLYLRLKDRIAIERVGFYVAGLDFYENFLAANPDFENRFAVLKEWEIYQKADGHKPNLERIRVFEDEIGDPTLWGSVVTDRRLYMGKKATFRQDYMPRFSHKEQLAIIDVALQKIDRMFREVEPDLICTLYTATFGDCLGHMFAEARGIRSLDLRLARLKNYVMLVDGVHEPPPHIVDIFEQFRAGIPDELKKEAEDYIESVVKKNAMYEGVVPAADKKGEKGKNVEKRKKSFSSNAFLKTIVNIIKKCRKSKRAPYCYDYQNPGLLLSLFYNRLINPVSLNRIRSKLRKSLVGKNDLGGMNYILYPLHSEPELVLTQFARPFLNQIEAIRNISLSMPIGMVLLVKEHPIMLGRRSVGFYEKILEIPNVRLVDFDLSSEVVLGHAVLVVIIRGAIGLEAVIKKKPVVSLGKSLFDILPPHMFRSCWNLYELPQAIRDMMNNYRYDDDALIRYLASVMRGSAPVNLVSDLLGKSGRFRTDVASDERPYEQHPHLDVLADYFYERVNDARQSTYSV
jgi:hypothetical protein